MRSLAGRSAFSHSISSATRDSGFSAECFRLFLSHRDDSHSIPDACTRAPRLTSRLRPPSTSTAGHIAVGREEIYWSHGRRFTPPGSRTVATRGAASPETQGAQGATLLRSEEIVSATGRRGRDPQPVYAVRRCHRGRPRSTVRDPR